jgi:GntR family transcriptional regulator, rspAB operon transcriptional repressor
MSSLSSHKLKRSADVAEGVFQRLVESILRGELSGGQPLREAAVARAWNVSRTPLREAVRRASEIGLLVLRPNRMPLVRLFCIDDMRALYSLRELLEVHALQAAWPALLGRPCEKMLTLAQKAAPPRTGWQDRCLALDATLHQWWTVHCGNPWLKADFDRHYQLLRIFQRWMGRNPPALIHSYHEHLAILNAIQQRDRRAALATLRNHIRQSVRLIEAAMQDETDRG